MMQDRIVDTMVEFLEMNLDYVRDECLVVPGWAVAGGGAFEQPVRDRKSTRLNSSH